MELLPLVAVSGLAIMVFAAVHLLSKNKKRLTDRLLSGWLIALGVNQLFAVVIC